MLKIRHLSVVAFLFGLIGCGGDPTQSRQDLPPDTFTDGNEGRVWWSNPSLPPTNYNVQGQFRAATAWLTMVDDQRVNDGSTIELDYLRLYARANGVDHLVASDEYDNGIIGGGLFERSPWFGNGGASRAQLRTYASFQGGTALLPVEQCGNCVWHAWVEDYPRPTLPFGTERVWVETRFRIRGAAFLQLGWDYYRGTSDIGCDIDMNGTQDPGYCEAGKSHWMGQSTSGDGWQVLTLGR